MEYTGAHLVNFLVGIGVGVGLTYLYQKIKSRRPR